MGCAERPDRRFEERSCISNLVRATAASYPDNDAVLAPGRKALKYGDLAALVESIAGQLDAAGLGSDDRVAVVLGNGPELAVAFLAIASCATCAPLNPAYGAAEFEFYLSDLAAKAVVVEAGSDSSVIGVARVRGIEVLEIRPEAGAEAGRFTLAGGRASRGGGRPRFAGPEDVALVLHTSGTTSRPKLVPLTHANLSASAVHVGESLGLGPTDRCLNVMPLFHIHGLVAATLASLAAGASVACCPGFYAPEFFDWLDRVRPTWYTAVPTMHQAILARAEASRPIIARSSLRFIRSSSAALPPSVLAELERTFGVPVIEAYGMTEAAHQVASNPLPPRQRKPGTVGMAAGPRIAIMGESGRLLDPGEVGEVVIRGPNVTAGYERNPDANREAFVDGWFRTGDQGMLDDDGYLTLTGRLKEIINRGGEKIAPREVNEVHSIRAGHHTMFEGPGLSELAAALRECLARDAPPEKLVINGREAPLH